MKNKGNKGITLMSLIISMIILMFITGAIIYNTQNHLSVSKINKLRLDIDALNGKVDEYYLKYGELPTLCNYTQSKEIFLRRLKDAANEDGAALNNEVNPNDGNEYDVIDVEKFDGLTLNYGYEQKGDFFKAKRKMSVDNENELYIINRVTHQIYFPHGVVADNTMYYTF